jgi:hypothetical protein
MMRQILEAFPEGQSVYVFTTHGHVHIGTIVHLIDDNVWLRAPDGATTIALNLSDVSGVRPHVQEPEESLL